MDYSPKRLIKLLEERGYILVRVKGSHHLYAKQNERPIPVPMHGSKDLGKGLFLKILKDAGINKENI